MEICLIPKSSPPYPQLPLGHSCSLHVVLSSWPMTQTSLTHTIQDRHNTDFVQGLEVTEGESGPLYLELNSYPMVQRVIQITPKC